VSYLLLVLVVVSIYQAWSTARVNRELLAVLQEQKEDRAYERWLVLLARDADARRTFDLAEFGPKLRPFVARAISEGRMIEVEPGVVRAV
jgi:hypothetical protein